MKRLVEKLNEAELLRSHPISGLVPGWFFRVVETSNMAAEFRVLFEAAGFNLTRIIPTQGLASVVEGIRLE